MPATPTADTQAPLIGFRRDLRVEFAGRGAVYVFSERGVTALRGESTVAVAGTLDGSRDLSGLLASPPAGLTAGQMAAVIARLAEAGIVTLRSRKIGSGRDEPALGYWESAGLDAGAAAEGTETGRLALRAVGDLDPLPIADALRAAGLTVNPTDDPALAQLSVVLCADYLHPDLAEIDAAHRRAGTPWLLAKPTGAVTWLGPVFLPERSGCWHCVAERLWRHRSVESCAQQELGRHGPAQRPRVSVPALSSAAAHLIALEATKWLAGYRDPAQRDIRTFDSLDLSSRAHRLPVAPQCGHCGDPDLMRAKARQPVVLAARPRSRDAAGGHRARSAEDTLAAYEHLISPITGIVPDIRRAEYGPSCFNSFRSGPNVAARGHDLGSLRAALRIENGGKGITSVQARMSALGEAVERYCGSFHGDEEVVSASFSSLGADAVHPNRCQLFAPDQFRDRDSWNREHSSFQYVPPVFDEDAVIGWTPVWSLTQRRHRLLPTELLYFGSPAQSLLSADSNGNAAGASLEDAVLQGLLEVIERDAVALWWYCRDRVPGVDLAAFGDPWLAEMRAVYADLGRSLWVLDLTADLGVPTMAACSARNDGSHVLFGFGAHLDAPIAVRRAVTELNQLMPALLAAEQDGCPPCDDADATRWFDTANVANQPYLSPDPARRLLGPADYSCAQGEDIFAEIEAIRRRLEARHLEMLVLDQTRPDIGLPVVKVVVPGLRHFWRRLAPGRLFDVPVRLGRRAVAPTRAELNPIPMFL